MTSIQNALLRLIKRFNGSTLHAATVSILSMMEEEDMHRFPEFIPLVKACIEPDTHRVERLVERALATDSP